MKVNDPNNSVSTTSAGSAAGTARAKQTQETELQKSRGYGISSPGVGGDDNVRLSDLAQSLQGLKEAVAVDSPEHTARVEQIAKAYAAGNYQVNAEATAAGLIDDGIQTSPRNS